MVREMKANKAPDLDVKAAVSELKKRKKALQDKENELTASEGRDQIWVSKKVFNCFELKVLASECNLKIYVFSSCRKTGTRNGSELTL